VAVSGIATTLFWARLLLLAVLWGAVALLAWTAWRGEEPPGEPSGAKRRRGL
jgi:hypothetical protein